MKQFIAPTYTFTPGPSGVGTVNLSGISGFNIKYLVAIINQTRGETIYATGCANTRYTNVVGSTVTLFYNTSSQNAGDVLQIVYEQIANPQGVTNGSWQSLKTFFVDTVSANFNARPSSGDFVTVTGLNIQTTQLEVIAKIKTTPTADYRLYVWIDDGTEVYCVSPAGGSAGENNISIQNVEGPYDGVAPVLVDLKRYTPTIRVAANVVLDTAAVVMDVNGNCINTGFTGGEECLLSTSGIFPRGLSANIEAFDAAADTFTYTGASFADGEFLRFNYLGMSAASIPPLGLSATANIADIVVPTDELVLDGRVPNPFVVGDLVRLRIFAANAVFPTANGLALNAVTTYIVTHVSGQSIKLSTDGVQPVIFNPLGAGQISIFKFPYDYVYMKGTNQVSRTLAGPAIDFVNQENASPVTVSSGLAAQFSPTALGTWNLRELGNTYAFTVSAIGTAISSGAVYRVTVGAINYDYTFGNGASIGDTLLRSTAATGAAPATGTLTLQSGTGPATIAYTASNIGVISGNALSSVVWSGTQFVAVSTTGVGNRVITSPDGITWTAQRSAADNAWQSIAWAPSLSLFAAVANSGTNNRVMTSPDGITWTIRTTPVDNSWSSVTWSGSLFVAVAITGIGTRVMTSPDGINWTARQSAADFNWTSVVWAGGTVNLFVAVANSGQGQRVMTSPDGITWTLRTSALTPANADQAWNSVTYSSTLDLLVAVGASGGVMTSADGINWTYRVFLANTNAYLSVVWADTLGLFVAVANTGTGTRIMTSPDGIAWTQRASPADNAWHLIAWSSSLGRLVAIATSATANSVMTSDAASYVGHGFSAGKELIVSSTTAAGVIPGLINYQKLYVVNPTTYSYQLATSVGGTPIATLATTISATTQVFDSSTGAVVPTSFWQGVPSLITLGSHFLGLNSPCTLAGVALPGGYTVGQTFFPLTLLSNSFQASPNKTTPLAFSSAGTSVTLTSIGTFGYLVLEKMKAFVAQVPAPTDNVVRLANTSSGPALNLFGGSGNYSIVDSGPLEIKATSYVKVRAI